MIISPTCDPRWSFDDPTPQPKKEVMHISILLFCFLIPHICELILLLIQNSWPREEVIMEGVILLWSLICNHITLGSHYGFMWFLKGILFLIKKRFLVNSSPRVCNVEGSWVNIVLMRQETSLFILTRLETKNLSSEFLNLVIYNMTHCPIE